MKNNYFLLLLFWIGINVFLLDEIQAQSAQKVDTGGFADLVSSAVQFKGQLVYIKQIGMTGRELWQTDGTPTNTKKLSNLPEKSQGPLVVLGSNLYFQGEGKDSTGTTTTTLWKTDGSVQGAEQVKSKGGVPAGKVTGLSILNGALIFTTVLDYRISNTQINLPDFTVKLRRTDGTENGTSVLKTLYGACSPLHQAGNILVFNLDNSGPMTYPDPSFGRIFGLWKTDGTSVGTVRLNEDIKDLNLSNRSTFYTFKNSVYTSHSTGLWKTDIATGTTKRVEGLAQNESYSLIGQAGERLFLIKNRKLNGNDDGTDLMTLDASSEIPKLVKAFAGANKLTFSQRSAAELKGKLIFIGSNQLWVSDGTENGTTILFKDRLNVSETPVIIKDHVYFSNFSTLYRTDGNVQGTEAVSGTPQVLNSTVSVYTALADKLLFGLKLPASTSGYDSELWALNPYATSPCSVVVTISGSLSYCAGQSTNLVATPTGGTAPYTYQWKQGTNSVGSSQNTLTVSSAGSYGVEATDSKGCKGTSAVVSVTQGTCPNPPPTPTITTPPGSATASGPITLTASSGLPTATGITYQWLLNGTAISGATSATYTASQSGSYAVSVTANGQTITSPVVLVTINLLLGAEPTDRLVISSVTVHPNPATDEVSVEIRADKKRDANVQVVNALGQTLSGQKVELRFGTQTIRLTLPERSGIYYLQIQADGNTLVRKVLKVK